MALGLQDTPNDGLLPVSIPIPSFAIGYGQTFSQDLGVSPFSLQQQPNHLGYVNDGVYQLRFAIVGESAAYPGYYDVEVSFGTQILCEVYGWTTRKWTEVTATCPSPGYIIVDQALPSGGPVQGSKNLVFTSTVPGWGASFKNVSLTFTPE